MARVSPGRSFSWQRAWLLLAGVFVLQFSAILFRGELIFPHSNALETGALREEQDSRKANRKFSDLSSAFLPELTNNLASNSRGWLPTWNPHVELGRPALQVSGLSRAYLLTNLLSVFTRNPLTLHTVLVLATVALTAAFTLLFLRALGLGPAAAVFGAIGLGFTTTVSYWLSFVMFLSALCWSIALLWLITEFTRQASWLLALGIAFATYSLLLTAYPQIIILYGYIIAGYTVVRLLQMPAGNREKMLVAGALFGCAACGALASLPVYLDVWVLFQESGRAGGLGDSFFLGVLPPLHEGRALATFLVTVFDWSWLGNAIEPSFPVRFNGLSFTPIFASLICTSFLLRKRREVLFWQVALLACLAATVIPGLYLFAVHHLGFGLSRIQLLIGGIVPGFVLGAYTIEALLRGELRLTTRSVACLLGPLLAEVLVAVFLWPRERLDLFAILLTLFLLAACLCALYFRSSSALVLVAVFSAFFYGRTLLLTRPLESIHLSSPLIDAIKAGAPDGQRFAIGERSLAQLPPNQEAMLGLSSVNSYESLMSRPYRDLTKKWSATGAGALSRQFKSLDVGLALSDREFAFSNVGIILSVEPLDSAHLKLFAEVGGIKTYQPLTAPIGLLQTPQFQRPTRVTATIEASPERQDLPVARHESGNDFKKIEVTPSSQETLLFFSQQYHRAWRAVAEQQKLRTVIVNGFYQGVILPPHTAQIDLSFRPFVLWSWLPQLFFAIAGVFLVGRALVSHIRRDTVGSGA